MNKDTQDELRRAYATLKALRDNIDKMQDYSIPEKYSLEFHNVLSKIESIGINISEFRIPDSLIKQRLLSSSMNGGRSYSEEKYVERRFILVKIDAILGYFEMITSPEAKRIGFRKPED